jgi:hypothetical protein
MFIRKRKRLEREVERTPSWAESIPPDERLTKEDSHCFVKDAYKARQDTNMSTHGGVSGKAPMATRAQPYKVRPNCIINRRK